MPILKKNRAPSPSALPDVTLTGTRLTVRTPRLSDGAAWAETRNRNRAFLAPYEATWPDAPMDPAFFAQRLERQAADWEAGRSLPTLIFGRDGGLIGGININNIARGAAQHATLGYWLDEREQGQGLMAEALRLLIGYGFAELGLHRFNAGCLTHNTRSHRLLLKIGFRIEGLAEKYLEIAGAWQDHVLFGLPVERWPARGLSLDAPEGG